MAKTDHSSERPLAGSTKLSLIAGAGAVILAFYVFAVSAVVLLLLVFAVELGLLLVLLRFGLSGVMVRQMQKHTPLIGIVLRSFVLRKRAEFRIALKREEAPGLFTLMEGLSARLQIVPPRDVALEMPLNAWVQLKGYRQGKGRTLLGIGYDLLAGLNVAEVEGVLAHEMVHARQVRRGFSRWLSKGLGRLTALAGELHAEVDRYRRAKTTARLAGSLLKLADRFARLGAWLVATYSRQDEFEADHGAAVLCGAAPVRSALRKLDRLETKLARLPWSQRVAQLNSGQPFSQWLVNELAVDANDSTDHSAAVFNAYSTHPLVRDRLAALPAEDPDGPRSCSAPGIGLLAEPDALAEKLMAEIQRTLVEQERKDSAKLRQWARKTRGGADIRPLQTIPLLLGPVGFIGAGMVWAYYGLLQGSVVLVATLGLCVLLFRVGRYRDGVMLPVPDFSALKTTPRPTFDAQAWLEVQKPIEAEFKALVVGKAKRKAKEALLVAECYAALGRCDYVRAHVAARVCQELQLESVEATLGMAVASAALSQGGAMSTALTRLRKSTGLHSRSVVWGVAWAMYLCGDFAAAEGFLDQAIEARPHESTFHAMRAVCRYRRGKVQSAIVSARESCAPVPPSKEHAKVLIDLLLTGGFIREAEEQLAALETEIPNDTELQLSKIECLLLKRCVDAADALAEALARTCTDKHLLVRLGGLYENAREDLKAARYYGQAIEAAHYPEAQLGLARLALHRQDKEQARAALLATLDTEKALGQKGQAPLVFFLDVVAMLRSLRNADANCSAWIARFDGQSAPVAFRNVALVVWAREMTEAKAYVAEITGAIQPNAPPPLPGSIAWEEAPREQQPVGPVHPGIHGVVS